LKDRRPQIVILVANLPAEKDRRVIRECLSLEAAGFGVTVVAPRGDRSLKILPGSAGTRLRPFPVFILGSGVVSFAAEFVWSFLWMTVRLLGEIVRGRAHAVQVCNPPDVYWPLALLLRALGRPWVFDHHDLSPEVYISRGGTPNPWVSRLLVAFEWLTLRTATEVIATNESFKDNDVRRGVSPARITVVRNGPAQAEIARRSPASPADGSPVVHTIVYLGVFGPQDNVEGAILAADGLTRLRGRDDWRLVLAGDGETAPALRKLAADRGMHDVVEFTGWLESPEVDALLRDATVALQPDLPTRMNHLSTMAKTVEYLGRGVPVVAVDLIETRRSVGDAGLYVPTGDPAEFVEAINTLLDDPAMREQMRLTGLARFRDALSWEHQADAYVGVWRRLLAKRLRRAEGARIPAPRRSPEGDTTAPQPAPVAAAEPADAS
jgi:glycosyltransferase involved in cell wall biosynthesis